jgi:hypothetical protein
LFFLLCCRVGSSSDRILQADELGTCSTYYWGLVLLKKSKFRGRCNPCKDRAVEKKKKLLEELTILTRGLAWTGELGSNEL